MFSGGFNDVQVSHFQVGSCWRARHMRNPSCLNSQQVKHGETVGTGNAMNRSFQYQHPYFSQMPTSPIHESGPCIVSFNVSVFATWVSLIFVGTCWFHWFGHGHISWQDGSILQLVFHSGFKAQIRQYGSSWQWVATVTRCYKCFFCHILIVIINMITTGKWQSRLFFPKWGIYNGWVVSFLLSASWTQDFAASMLSDRHFSTKAAFTCRTEGVIDLPWWWWWWRWWRWWSWSWWW